MREEGNSVERFARDVTYGLAVDLTKKLLVLVGGSLLAAAGLLIWDGGTVPAWSAALALLAAVVVTLAFRGRAIRALRGQVRSTEEVRDDRALEAEVYADTIERHETYSGHVAAALDALQRIVAGDIAVPVPHYIEAGVLEPARDLMTAKPAEAVRLSVLLPDARAERWTMAWSAGHTVAGSAKYEERIVDTVSRHAFETGETQLWEDTASDRSFRQNPLASSPSRSMVSVPLRWGDATVGVFNVISSEPFAFDSAEQNYIDSLAAIISVAVGVLSGESGPRAAESDRTGR
jgi:GAF domain-containing protein